MFDKYSRKYYHTSSHRQQAIKLLPRQRVACPERDRGIYGWTIDFFMLTRAQKKEIIESLADKLSRQKSVVFFDFTGLTVNQFQELRSQLRAEDIDCQVGKKSLIGLALRKTNLDKKLAVKDMSGQIALAAGYGDEVMPAKIVYDFSKENEQVKILAGLVNGDYLDAEAMLSLAKLPAKPELLAKLVGSLASPLSGLANALSGNIRKLLFVLSRAGGTKAEA